LCGGFAAAQKLHYFFLLPAPLRGVRRGLGGRVKFLHLKEQLLQTLLFPGYSLNFHKQAIPDG